MSQTRNKASNLFISKENKISRSKGIYPKHQKRHSNVKEQDKLLKKDLRKLNKKNSALQFHILDFWPKVDTEYFKPLTKADKEILNALIIDPDTGQDHESFSFAQEVKDYENIFSESYQKIYLQDHLNSGQPFKNMDFLSIENTTSSSSPDLFSSQTDTDSSSFSSQHVISKNSHKSELDKEIENQQEILKEFARENKEKFLSLKSLLSAELTKNSLVKIQREVERECLKNYIINLEDQQAAESLQSVNTCKQFCRTKQIIHSVNFDEALSFNEIWIDDQTLNRLDKFREILNLSIDGFKPKMTLFSKDIANKKQDLKTSKRNEIKQNLCHFCKAILTDPDDEPFIACRYRSSRMGPPQHDPDKSLATLYIKEETFEKDRKQAKFDKMGVLSSYQLFEGEKFCARKFCESCLRHEFDIDIRHLKNKTFWKCPFCKGMCNCSRCLRNTQIKNLLQMYLKIDGDPLLIKEQTCFGRYLSQCDLKIYFKNNQTPFPDDMPEPNLSHSQRRHHQIDERIGRTIPTPENPAVARDKRRLNRTLSIEQELPKKRIHGENTEKLDDLVIAIDRESEQCFMDPQNSFEKKKPLSQKKALIKRQDPIKQQNARNRIFKESNEAIITSSIDDKENQSWETNKQSSPSKNKRISAKNNLLKKTRSPMKNKDVGDKQRLSKDISEIETEGEMNSSPEILSKKQLDQELFEDYCVLRSLFEIRFGKLEDEKEDRPKANKKTYLGVIELE